MEFLLISLVIDPSFKEFPKEIIPLLIAQDEFGEFKDGGSDKDEEFVEDGETITITGIVLIQNPGVYWKVPMWLLTAPIWVELQIKIAHSP